MLKLVGCSTFRIPCGLLRCIYLSHLPPIIIVPWSTPVSMKQRPAVTLSRHRQPLRPTSTKVCHKAGACRGGWPSGRFHSSPMAPATHTCSDAPALTNLTALPFDAEDCRGGELRLPIGRTHRGRRGVDAPVAIIPPEVSSKRKAEQELGVKARAENLVREPAFITAVILTALILLGGFIVTKLSHTQLPQRRPRICERLGGGASSSSTSSLSAGPSASPVSPLVQELCPQTHVQHLDQPLYMPADQQPSSPFSPPYSPMHASRSPVQACPSAGAVRPDVYIHEASSIPQIVLAQPHGTFSQIEDLAKVDEIGDHLIARPLEKRERVVADTILGSDSSPSLEAADTPERWTCIPKQASVASDHSTEETSPIDLFSSSSTISSLTSASDALSDLAELDEDQEVYGVSDAEFTFEVKRGHTQSIELAKGRLMSWGPLPGTASSQVISIVGADTEQDHTKDPRPARRFPIPALIITEPSTLSLYTEVSSTSNLSIDLSQFPIPPLCLEPAAFWQKLDDEIDSSLALKQRRLNH